MYMPYKNTFWVRKPACSQSGDPCGVDMPCAAVSCTVGADAAPMVCMGTPYLRARNMGACYPALARVGDPCVVGVFPDCNNAPGALPAAAGPRMVCQQSLDVDSRANSAPSFAAPLVGAGFCVPVSWTRSGL
jgi:hypothetical protein